MRQILIIFRQDTRHLWPEILLVLTVTASLAWVYPYQWRQLEFVSGSRPGFHLDLHHLQLLANTVVFLLPVSWFVLISRVVHSENLLGDRQFWVTRPYDWRRLLASKSLFLAAYVCIPFLVSQAILLHRAWLSHLPNLGFQAILVSGLIILPLFAISTVMSTLVRIVGLLLVAVAAGAGIGFLASTSDHYDQPSVAIPFSDRYSIPLLIVVCVIVLCLQYSSRRLWLSRALLLAAPLLILSVAISPFEGHLLNFYYPLLTPGDRTAFGLSLAAAEDPDQITGNPEPGKITVRLPLMATALSAGQAVQADDLRLTLTAADGHRFTSAWQAISAAYLTPDARLFYPTAIIDKAFFDQYRNKPLTLEIELAATILTAGEPAKTVYRPDRNEVNFTLPHIGVCDFQPESNRYFTDMSCRVPFHQPDLARITILRSPAPCTPYFLTDPAAIYDSTWTGSVMNDPADTGFTPVWLDTLNFPTTQTTPTPMHAQTIPLGLCPGAPVTVTPYRVLKRFRTRFRFEGAVLAPFKPRTVLPGSTANPKA